MGVTLRQKHSCLSSKAPLNITAVDYTRRSKVHGIRYFFNVEDDFCPTKVFWMSAVATTALFGVVLSTQVNLSSFSKELSLISTIFAEILELAGTTHFDHNYIDGDPHYGY